MIGERESQKQRVSINDDFVPIATPNIDLDKQDESQHYESEEKYTEEDHDEEDEVAAATPQVIQQATQKSEHEDEEEEDMDEDYENDYEEASK